jgi:hypothetical protein
VRGALSNQRPYRDTSEYVWRTAFPIYGNAVIHQVRSSSRSSYAKFQMRESVARYLIESARIFVT